MHLKSHLQWSLSFTLDAWTISTPFWLSKAPPLQCQNRCMMHVWKAMKQATLVSNISVKPCTRVTSSYLNTWRYFFSPFDYKSSKENTDDQNIYPLVKEWFSSLPCMCIMSLSASNLLCLPRYSIWGEHWSGILNMLRGTLIRKCFLGHILYHLYPVVTQVLYMCF